VNNEIFLFDDGFSFIKVKKNFYILRKWQQKRRKYKAESSQLLGELIIGLVIG
jgi:hypothetical protein